MPASEADLIAAIVADPDDRDARQIRASTFEAGCLAVLGAELPQLRELTLRGALRPRVLEWLGAADPASAREVAPSPRGHDLHRHAPPRPLAVQVETPPRRVIASWG